MTEPNETEPARDPAESRTKILSAALEEFCQYGLSGARMDRIAETAGLNKAMIYYYFSSKEELHRAVIDRFLAPIPNMVKQFAESAKTLEELLNMVATIYTKILKERPQMVKLILHELADGRKETLETFANVIKNSGAPAQLSKRFTAEMEKGTIRRMDPRQATISFIIMILGYGLTSPIMDVVHNITDHDAFLEARKTEVVHLFLNGVRP